jgi:hypothetical protein
MKHARAPLPQVLANVAAGLGGAFALYGPGALAAAHSIVTNNSAGMGGLFGLLAGAALPAAHGGASVTFASQCVLSGNAADAGSYAAVASALDAPALAAWADPCAAAPASGCALSTAAARSYGDLRATPPTRLVLALLAGTVPSGVALQACPTPRLPSAALSRIAPLPIKARSAPHHSSDH